MSDLRRGLNLFGRRVPAPDSYPPAHGGQPGASVEAMLARFQVGSKVSGTVLQTGAFGAAVDVGGLEVRIPLPEIQEYLTQAPHLILSVGKSVTLRVEEVSRAPSPSVRFKLCHEGPKPGTAPQPDVREEPPPRFVNSLTPHDARTAMETGEVLLADVCEIREQGVVLDIAGVDATVALQEADLHPPSDPADLLGWRLAFMVLSCGVDGIAIACSRRAVQQKQRADRTLQPPASRLDRVRAMTWAAIREAAASQTLLCGRIAQWDGQAARLDFTHVTAHIPEAELDLQPGERPEMLVGATVAFLVSACSEADRTVTCSRRDAANVVVTRESLVEGQVYRGDIVYLDDKGAQVAVSGLLCHLPKTEMFRGPTDLPPSGYLEVGEKVDVLVESIWADRISVSRKAALPAIELYARQKYAVGTEWDGHMIYVPDAGLQVELEPGFKAVPRFRRAVGEKVRIRIAEWAPGRRFPTAEQVADPEAGGRRRPSPPWWVAAPDRGPAGSGLIAAPDGTSPLALRADLHVRWDRPAMPTGRVDHFLREQLETQPFQPGDRPVAEVVAKYVCLTSVQLWRLLTPKISRSVARTRTRRLSSHPVCPALLGVRWKVGQKNTLAFTLDGAGAVWLGVPPERWWTPSLQESRTLLLSVLCANELLLALAERGAPRGKGLLGCDILPDLAIPGHEPSRLVPAAAFEYEGPLGRKRFLLEVVRGAGSERLADRLRAYAAFIDSDAAGNAELIIMCESEAAAAAVHRDMGPILSGMPVCFTADARVGNTEASACHPDPLWVFTAGGEPERYPAVYGTESGERPEEERG